MFSIVFVVAVIFSPTVIGYPQFNSFGQPLFQDEFQGNPSLNNQVQENPLTNNRQSNNDGQFQFNPNNPFLNNNAQNGNSRQNQFPQNNNGQQSFSHSANQFPNNPFLNPNQNNQDGGNGDQVLTQPIPTGRPNQGQTTTQAPLPGETTTPNAVPGADTPRTPCEQRCAITPQYNPVCGTDGETYTNAAQLQCAQRCGISVQIRHIGQCARSG